MQSREIVNGSATIVGRGWLRLGGWAFTESTGTAKARVLLEFGGRSITITLGPNESTRDFVPGQGLEAEPSITATVTEGQAEGCIMYEGYRE